MKKTILILMVLAFGLTGYSQTNFFREYKFYSSDEIVITDDDTTTRYKEFICIQESKKLDRDKFNFLYRIDVYETDTDTVTSEVSVHGSLIFKDGMAYPNDGYDFEFDSIQSIYHSQGWKAIRRNFLRKGLKGKWITPE